MVPKTAEIVRQAKAYMGGGSEPSNLSELFQELRIRKLYKLLRDVIARVRKEDGPMPPEEELLILEAFSYFRDRALPDDERWKCAEQTLVPLKETGEAAKQAPWKTAEARELAYAIQQERDINEGRMILRSHQENYEKVMKYAKTLKGYSAFSYARRLFTEALRLLPSTHQDVSYLTQQRALCTYKDPDLPLLQRLDQALHILNGTEGTPAGPDPGLLPEGILSQSKNPETLGLAGAICKRKWEAEGRRSDLEKSYQYYLRGHVADMGLVNYAEIPAAGSNAPGAEPLDVVLNVKPDHNFGYAGINAAFVLDLLDHIEGNISRRGAAQDIRKMLSDYLEAVIRVPKDKFKESKNYEEWWVRMTLVEAYFGLGKYEDAGRILEAVSRQTDPWKFEASVRQLVQLAKLQGVDLRSAGPTGVGSAGSVARTILESFLGASLPLHNVVRGKIGLALSGGGFRASFYHLGVLAKLAELDILKEIEVVSCVSGGSIVGAHYYLEVRRLLQSKSDGSINREDYIEIVRRVADQFRKGTQRNVRMRVFGNVLANLKMVLFPSYSRTEHVGKLLENFFYSEVPDGEGDDPRWLNELFIEPKDALLTFQPKLDNWRRKNKVPIFIINATSLNTGNNWQFTASWMGEPPPANPEDHDGKARLRRTYYSEAPKRHRKVRLGKAVAASACVPGVFEPIVLNGMYPDYTVRLVDGGVFDNQGLSGLLDEGCNMLFVSDGSGQTNADENPRAGVLGPLWRSNDITMQCVRDGQLRQLQTRRRAEILSKVMTVHLKRELNPILLDWIGCMDPAEGGERSLPPWRKGDLTSYRVLRTMQTDLSKVRTDLDSFSDAEAHALMTSGYLMMECAARSELRDIVADDKLDRRDTSLGWEFLHVEDAMSNTSGTGRGHERLEQILKASGGKAFKIFKLSPLMSALALFGVLVGVLAISAATVWATSGLWTHFHVRVAWKWLMPSLAVLLLGKVAADIVAFQRFRPKMLITTPLRVLSGVGFAVVGWALVGVHLIVFDKMFLRYGAKETFDSRS